MGPYEKKYIYKLENDKKWALGIFCMYPSVENHKRLKEVKLIQMKLNVKITFK